MAGLAVVTCTPKPGLRSSSSAAPAPPTSATAHAASTAGKPSAGIAETPSGASAAAGTASAAAAGPVRRASVPLRLVKDAPLPGKAARFDYQAVDSARGRLLVAHMNDASVVAVRLSDFGVERVVPNVPVARGIAVGNEVKRVFVTSSPHSLVVLDADSLDEIARVTTGTSPDGVAWDAAHRLVAVSDQTDGALSLLADGGTGKRVQVKLGRETGNVVFDARRALVWVAVERATPPGALVAVDPLGAKAVKEITLPGCSAPHGVLLDAKAATAFVACEENAHVARVPLDGDGTRAPALAATGTDPDVLALDPALGFVYVAAESGDLSIFDAARPGLVLLGRQHPADGSHSVAVDAATHHVFFPLAHGPNGAPALRIMQPEGIAP